MPASSVYIISQKNGGDIMNIYKTKYGTIKDRLWRYGKTLKGKSLTQSFLENEADNSDDWNHVITSFLTYWCDDSERELVDLAFFKRYSAKAVGLRLFMDESVCSRKKEKIMDCLIGLAMQAGLIFIDLTNGQIFDKAACCCDCALDDCQWEKVSRIIAERLKMVSPNARSAVDAMLYVQTEKIPWNKLPERFGPWKNICNRYLHWKKIGLWRRICKAIGVDCSY